MTEGKRKIPRFRRQNWKKGRIGKPWRKPRGIDNKQRISKSGCGAMPRIGYRQPRKLRGLHPSGKLVIIVRNVKALEALPQGAVVMVASTVGAKKREAIKAACRAKKIKVN
ncbi:MAG: eL32 family ribosomal protein [Candidatus Micrarchaeota archaeon]